MDVIDDEGRLFGTVNVIDALVVLLVAAVVIAGAVFVLSPGPDEDTRYATVDLGAQPSFIVDDLSEGDVMEVEGHGDNLTITDVHLGPAAGDDAQVIVRVEITGETVEVGEDRWQFQFAGEPLRSGQELTLEMLEYEATGQVTAIGTDDPTLSTTETDVFAVTTVSGEVADNMQVGDAYTVNGIEIGTIEHLQIYPTNGTQQTALLGLQLSTHDRAGTTYFGDTAVRIGGSVPFESGAYELSAEILNPSSADLVTTETAVVIETTVPASIAEEIQPGDSYDVAGVGVAEIEEVHRFPTNDPDDVLVRLGVTYTTFQDGDTIRFGDREIRTGAALPFETGDYDLNGEIIQRGTHAVETTSHTVVIESTVPNAVADRLTVGDTFELAGTEVSRIEEVTIYPTTDRDTKRVFLGLELTTEVRDDRLVFGETALRDGETVAFRTSSYALSGEIIDPDGIAEPGEPTTTEVTLKKTGVHPDRGDRIVPGLVEELNDEVLAEVTAVEREPAEVILESEDGEIFRRDHPVNEDLKITADLQTRETPTQLRFHGEEIREGDTIVLDLGRMTIQVELIEIHD